MKTNRNMAAKLLRNSKALILRLTLAIRHNSSFEISKAVLLIIESTIWLLCIVTTVATFFAGFVKPACFILSFLFLIVTGIINANIEDAKKLGVK